MDLLTYSVFAIPLWVAQFALYFYLRSARRMRESLVAKCAGSFLAVGSAGFALRLAGENPFAQVIFWFFLLCTAADALLEISFVPGMLVFGAAHVCLIFWLWGLGSPTWWSLALWVAVYILTAVLFRKELPTLGKLTAPFLLYPALLGAAWPWPRPCPLPPGPAGGPWPWAACYSISPTCWWQKTSSPRWPDKWQKPIMALYWAALYLISVGTWPR